MERGLAGIGSGLRLRSISNGIRSKSLEDLTLSTITTLAGPSPPPSGPSSLSSIAFHFRHFLTLHKPQSLSCVNTIFPYNRVLSPINYGGARGLHHTVLHARRGVKAWRDGTRKGPLGGTRSGEGGSQWRYLGLGVAPKRVHQQIKENPACRCTRLSGL